MNLNDLELSHGTCSACGRVDLLVQCSVGDYCCNACLKESIEKPDTGDARVFGRALVSGNARVFGDAQVYGNARVFDNARVFGDVKEMAK